MIGNIRLYHNYARLVVRSFGLQKAIDENGVDLPAAFIEVRADSCSALLKDDGLITQYQSASTALIHTFENDLEGPGFTRGCPDFVFTVLTYAAVSLLRVTQPQFAYLEPPRNQIFQTARQAADMLARSAMTPDHLPASQSVFLSRLIEVKSTETTMTRIPQQTFVPEMIDFEAFGQSLEGDQSKTQWPPAPFNFDLSSFTIPQPQGQDQNQNRMGHDTMPPLGDRTLSGMSMSNGMMSNNNNNAPIGNTATGSSSGNPMSGSSMPTDLDGWVAATTQFPMPGLSLGMGSNFGQDDLMFTQDSFWKSIFEGQPQDQGGQGIGMV